MMSNGYVIWKFKVPHQQNSYISVPKGTEFLRADINANGIFVWGLCDPDAEKEQRTMHVVGTGWTMHGYIPEWKHIDTVFDPPYVWHVLDGEIG